MPFRDQAYGGVLALGSVEHVADGPVRALCEFYRILRPGGVAIVTVPYGGTVRRTMRQVQRPMRFMRTLRGLRRLFGKADGGRSASDARSRTVRAWYPRFAYGPDGWYFYEYEFSKHDMRLFLAQTPFLIEREFVAFHDEGILHTFGRPAGRWNYERGRAEMSLCGRLLRLLPLPEVGHMLCYVIRKPDDPRAIGVVPCAVSPAS